MIPLIIGMPVFDRAWCLPSYFAAIEAQDYPLEDIGFIFVVSPLDPETVQCLVDFHSAHPEVRCFDIVTDHQGTHTSHPEGYRMWTRDKYHLMVKMRNNILDRVVCYDPERFFSLDSDILLGDPTSISQLVALTANHDAVSPLLFMTPDSLEYPSVMTWNVQGRGFRDPNYPLGTLFQADIIMAAVMMSKPVYQRARYHWHAQGEDLGWSLGCKTLGFQLWSASYLYVDHVMSRAALKEHQVTGDPRKLLLQEEASTQ